MSLTEKVQVRKMFQALVINQLSAVFCIVTNNLYSGCFPIKLQTLKLPEYLRVHHHFETKIIATVF